MKKFGWGFIGAGAIANRFMAGLMQVPDAYLAAVSSRTYEKAERLQANTMPRFISPLKS